MKSYYGFLLAACLLLPTSVDAAILTVQSELSLTNTLIDFESMAYGPTGSNSLVVGAATFTTLAPNFAIENVNPFGPAPANLVASKVLRVDDGGLFPTNYLNIRIDFSSPIGEIGLGFWDSTQVTNTLDAYSAGGGLLESAQFPSGPSGGIFASFAGIRRNSNDIAYVIVNNGNIVNELYGIDNFSFGVIPEPSSLIACWLAFALSCWSWCKRFR